MVRHFISRRAGFRFIVTCILACACGAIDATGQPFSVDAHIMSAGTSAQSASTCFRLTSTIAEPVSGYSTSTDFSLLAGFRAAAPSANDDIFFSGFEDCQ